MFEKMNVCSFFSGSSGNCTYIEANSVGILLDCGVAMKYIFAELERIGRSKKNISALFITHEHTDHIKSVGAIARSCKIPVFATRGTWRAMYNSLGRIDKGLINVVEDRKCVEIGGIKVTPFSVSHDAAEPVGYTF